MLPVVVLMSACGFLDEDPHSGQPQEKVITSASALYQQAVLSLYSHIGGSTDGYGLQGTYRGVYDLQTFASNEAIIPVRGGDWWDGGLWVDLHEHTWTVDNECCENSWRYLFQLVGLCNYSLSLLDEYGYLLTQDQSMSYNAEVRAVRAMAYMYLLDLFGRVPIVTKITMPVHDIYQSERSKVFDFVWDEMQFALLYLPDERSNNRGEYYGRVTKPVVHFMLMKMALNAEVWRDDDWTDEVRPDGKTIQLPCGEAGEKNAWEAVCFYGQQILSSHAGYVLCESQTNCFSTYNEDATENIFTISPFRWIRMCIGIGSRTCSAVSITSTPRRWVTAVRTALVRRKRRWMCSVTEPAIRIAVSPLLSSPEPFMCGEYRWCSPPAIR